MGFVNIGDKERYIKYTFFGGLKTRSEERAQKVGSLRQPKASKNLDMPFLVACSVHLKSDA